MARGDPDHLELERPIFVLAGGWRTGSTLLQRLLCSHPEVRVWGENRGLVEALREAWDALAALEPLSAQNRANLERDGHQGWIALANPPFACFREGMRALFRTYLAQPAARQGRPRWGFKEVRCDAAVARWLLELFPQARFVFLVRHPEACLASARGTTREGRGLLPEVGGPRSFVAHWTRVTRSLVDEADALPALLLRYEDLVADPEKACRELGSFLDLGAEAFDPAVFERKVRGWKREPRLEGADRRALRAAPVWEVAGRLGYAPVDSRHVLWRRLGRRVAAAPGPRSAR